MQGEVVCFLLTNTVRKCSELEVIVLKLVVLRASPVENVWWCTWSFLFRLRQNISVLIVGVLIVLHCSCLCCLSSWLAHLLELEKSCGNTHGFVHVVTVCHQWIKLSLLLLTWNLVLTSYLLLVMPKLCSVYPQNWEQLVPPALSAGVKCWRAPSCIWWGAWSWSGFLE